MPLMISAPEQEDSTPEATPLPPARDVTSPADTTEPRARGEEAPQDGETGGEEDAVQLITPDIAGEGVPSAEASEWQRHQERNPFPTFGTGQQTPGLSGVGTTITADLEQAPKELRTAVENFVADGELLNRKGCFKGGAHVLLAGRPSDALLRLGKAGEYNVSLVTADPGAGRAAVRATVIVVLIGGAKYARVARVFYGKNFPLPKRPA